MSIPNPIDQIKKDLHPLDCFDALVQQYLLNTVGVATDKYGVPAAVTDIHYDGGTYVELNASFCWLGRDFIIHIIRDEERFKVTVEHEYEYDVVDTGRLAEEILDFFFDYEGTIQEVLPHFEPADINPRTVFEGNIVYTGTYRGTPVDIIVDPAKNTWHARLGEDQVTDECDVGSQKIFYQAEKISDHLAHPRFPGCSPATGKTYVNDIRHLLEPADVVFFLENTEFDPEHKEIRYVGQFNGTDAMFTIHEDKPLEVDVRLFDKADEVIDEPTVTASNKSVNVPYLISLAERANAVRIKDLPEKKTPLTLEERIARLEKLHNID